MAPKPLSMPVEVAGVVAPPLPKLPKAGWPAVEAGTVTKPPKLGVGAEVAAVDPKAAPNPVVAALLAGAVVPALPKPVGAAAVVAVGIAMLPKPVDEAGVAGVIPNEKPPIGVEVAGADTEVVVVPKLPNAVGVWLAAPNALPKAGVAGVTEAVGVNPANPAGADVVAGAVDCVAPNAKPVVCGRTAVLPMLKGWATPTGAAVVAVGAPKEKGWAVVAAAV